MNLFIEDTYTPIYERSERYVGTMLVFRPVNFVLALVPFSVSLIYEKLILTDFS